MYLTFVLPLFYVYFMRILENWLSRRLLLLYVHYRTRKYRVLHRFNVCDGGLNGGSRFVDVCVSCGAISARMRQRH